MDGHAHLMMLRRCRSRRRRRPGFGLADLFTHLAGREKKRFRITCVYPRTAPNVGIWREMRRSCNSSDAISMHHTRSLWLVHSVRKGKVNHAHGEFLRTSP